MEILVLYLIIINALSLAFMLTDKVRAIKKALRIPERTLMLVAVAGGSFGGLLGMCLFRHKTRKPKFSIGIPLLLILHILLIAALQSHMA